MPSSARTDPHRTQTTQKYAIAGGKASLSSIGASSFELTMAANEKYFACVHAANWNFLFIFALSLLR